MSTTTKAKVLSLLKHLPDDCSIEDVQYHLYIIEKVRQGLVISETQGTISQGEAEALLSKWLIE